MKIAPDKKAHFKAGLALSLVAGLVLQSPIVGFGAATLFGVGKELYDMTGRGTPEWMDLWFTLGGGLVASVITYIILGAI